MTLLFGFASDGCYKATVNESETITDAKPAKAGNGVMAARAFGSVFPGLPHVERS
jgi:hypothetical protein